MCFRLYSAEMYSHLERERAPEILRAPLDSVVLHILELGLKMEELRLLETPSLVQLIGAFQRLKGLKAVKADKSLT